ncbi:MAG: EH signature domain-containing protein [Candidatus Binataceae bacterium]
MKQEPITDIDPLVALAGLRSLRLVLEREAHQPFAGLDIDLKTLRARVGQVGNTQKAATPRVSVDEYRKQWHEFCQGKLDRLSSRAERTLCWDADIATSFRFQDYLDRLTALSARSLQGLIRSCHQRWSDEFAQSLPAARVHARLNGYKGPNQVIRLWQGRLDMILGARAAETFGQLLSATGKPVHETCEAWNLDESTAFLLRAVRAALEVSLSDADRNLDIGRHLVRNLLGWPRWPDADFRRQSANIILATQVTTSFAEELKRFVLDEPRLGDPRLLRNIANWMGLDQAKSVFTQWLSRDDIVFFFEHVLPKGQDPHGRKAFWLHYIKHIKRSRPLLSWEDRSRLQAVRDKVGNFGHIEENTSAFMLDFGRVVAVEFSRAGNACYLYEKATFEKLIPDSDFWAAKPFRFQNLKRKPPAVGKISHFMSTDARGFPHWNGEMASFLAKYGIRPSE